MLEGLEISEVNLKELDAAVRIDAELYNKTYIQFKEAIRNIPHTTLEEECCVVRKGVFDMKSSLYSNKGVPFVRISDLEDMTINLENIVHIPIEEHLRNLKTELFENDIVLSKTALAACSIVNTERCNVSQDIVAVKLKDSSQLLSHYIVVFFNTRYGKELLQRRFTGNVQMHLNLDECKREILIPVFPISFQEQVRKLFVSAISKSNEAISLYKDAENELLEKINLKDWHPAQKSYNIKQLKESFLASGRLDAEHYQLKYDELESLIKSASYKSIAEIQQFNARGVQPDYVDGGEVSVINSKHILEDGLDYDNFEHTTPDFLYSHNRAQIRYGDILIYTTGANIGRTQVYLKHEPAIASNHVNILRVQGVNPIYLALVLNSQVGRLQTEKSCTGSAQAELYPSDIEKFIVPILPEEKQQTIADYVQKSVTLRQQAKQLLEDAKLKVEVVITGGGDNQIVTEYNRMIEQSTYYYRLAEWTLLEELYADKWTATTSVNYSVKPYSVCQTTGRLDAEYYQPKYDVLFEKLSHYHCNTISEIATIKKSIEPGSDAYCDSGVPFVRVSDITKRGISKPNIFLSRTEYNVEELRPKKDTILLSKDGSIGIAYKVEDDMDCITSGALLHLNVYNKKYLPDYLTLVLNSLVVRLQAERDSNGAIIQHWKPSEIERVIIPYLPMEKQMKISKMVQDSFNLYSKSKKLLDIAKKSVEIAINENEDKALDFINNYTNG